MNHQIKPLKTLLSELKKLAALPLAKATAMSPGMYLSADLIALENEKIFQKQWLCAGRTNTIPDKGDYFCYQLGDQPVVVIRQEKGRVKAFANVCRHRMMTLLEGSGSCKKIVCPYHAWTYAPDGRLVGAPYMDQRKGFDKKTITLPEIRCEIWHGWIYLTLNPDLDAVSNLLGELEPLVAPYKMENYIQIDQQDHVWQCNWKHLTENFMEGYHLPVTHRATVGGYFPVEQTKFSAGPPNPAFTYQFFAKTKDAPVGTAHPNNKRLKGQQRTTSILPTVFPSHMYALAPDHLWYLSLQPGDAGQVRIRYGAAIAPEVMAACKDTEKLIADTIAFLDKVNAEDRGVVEGIYRGARAPLSVAGPLCWLERENHEFTQYLARQLCN